MQGIDLLDEKAVAFRVDGGKNIGDRNQPACQQEPDRTDNDIKQPFGHTLMTG